MFLGAKFREEFFNMLKSLLPKRRQINDNIQQHDVAPKVALDEIDETPPLNGIK